MKVRKMQWFKVSAALMLLALLFIAGNSSGFTYVLPDTDQSLCYDTLDTVSPPSEGESFYGQDAQYWSSTQYMGLTMNGDSTTFGVNFADGRIVKTFTSSGGEMHLFNWSPGETGLSAGVYLCRLSSEYGHSELKTVYSGL